MTLWSRLASAMVFLVVATICALGLFGDGFAGFGRATLVVGVIAIAVALVLAAVIAKFPSRHLSQMTRAVEGLSRGEPVAMPDQGDREMATLSAAFAELSAQFGTKRNLLENTVESIRDAVVVADENAIVVVANAAARRLLGVYSGFDSLTGVRKFACFLSNGVTPLPIPDSRWPGRCAAKISMISNSWCSPNHPAQGPTSLPMPGRCATSAASFAGRLPCFAT